MNKEILEVLYQCDDNYATLTGVSMVSLLENNKDISEINVTLLDDNISEENIARLKKAVEGYGRKLTIVETQQIKQKLIDLQVTPYKGTYTTYYKLVEIGAIETAADRILYLDGDTLINGSLKPLLDIDMGENIMAAAYDCVLNEYKEILGLLADDPYYNCGVMLINKEQWKKQNCESAILNHFINTRSQYFIVDQDVLNILFRDKVKLMNATYNFNAGFYIYGIEPSYRIYNLNENYYFSKSDMANILSEGPIINHCMGGFTGRPWEADNIHPQNDLYNRYLAISPWSEEKKKFKKLSGTYRIQRFLYRVLPMSLYWRIHRYYLYEFYKKHNKQVQETK